MKTLVRIVNSFEISDAASYLGAGGYQSFFINDDFIRHDKNSIEYIYYPRSKRAVLQVVPIKNGNPLHPRYKFDMNEDKELIGKGNCNMLFSRNGTI